VTENSRSVSDRLHSDGYVFLPKWRVNHSTIDLAKSIGTILDIPSILNRQDIPIVQILKPHRQHEAPRDGYSRAFGLGDFPFHTDLAHWIRPPPYFMLRCLTGSSSVHTQLLPFSAIEEKLGSGLVARALVRTQKPRPSGSYCLLQVTYKVNGLYAFRWDTLFLISMTRAAEQIASLMSTSSWSRTHACSLLLADPGDTLIVDNRRMLHSRSSVKPNETDRQIERVYLSEIYA